TRVDHVRRNLNPNGGDHEALGGEERLVAAHAAASSRSCAVHSHTQAISPLWHVGSKPLTPGDLAKRRGFVRVMVQMGNRRGRLCHVSTSLVGVDRAPGCCPHRWGISIAAILPNPSTYVNSRTHAHP